jgi:hypothetical protein
MADYAFGSNPPYALLDTRAQVTHIFLTQRAGLHRCEWRMPFAKGRGREHARVNA